MPCCSQVPWAPTAVSKLVSAAISLAFSFEQLLKYYTFPAGERQPPWSANQGRNVPIRRRTFEEYGDCLPKQASWLAPAKIGEAVVSLEAEQPIMSTNRRGRDRWTGRRYARREPTTETPAPVAAGLPPHGRGGTPRPDVSPLLTTRAAVARQRRRIRHAGNMDT